MLCAIANKHTAEELGRYTVNMRGTTRGSTSFERKFINNRAVLFYSFHVTRQRTLFYVLPLLSSARDRAVAETPARQPAQRGLKSAAWWR
jgi:hypothetical protein